MSNNVELYKLGQSLWYDNIQRKLIEDGSLKTMIENGEIYGVTSNPSIFMKAISNSTDYDNAIQPMAFADWSPEDIFWQLAVEDIQAGADLLTPLYEKTNKGDGYISLEVDPNLANDTEKTIAEAKRLWSWVNRPNLCVKIPATKEGLPAIRAAIAAGLNINVTLIFSPKRYYEVMEAYISGLEDRVSAGLPIDHIASVASVFVSRIDGMVDKMLSEFADKGGPLAEQAYTFMGKTAVANSVYCYQLFKKAFGSERFAKLEKHGARVQRPLWASTSTKNPNYPDTKYVDELIAPQTVNTAPPNTIEFFKDHGTVAYSIEGKEEESYKLLQAYNTFGISLDDVYEKLEDDGVTSFSTAFTELMAVITDRSNEIKAQIGNLAPITAQRIASFNEVDTVKRFHNHDASLWTDNIEGQEEIRHRLGWVQAPWKSMSLIDDINALAENVIAEGYTHCTLLGMGGSSLAPEVMRLILGIGKVNGKSGLDLAILDSTDPVQVKECTERAPIEKTLFVVASKSGSTAEVHAFMDHFWAIANKELGTEEAPRHFVVVTDPGSQLIPLAKERNYRATVLADPNVGGRFSAMTAFGLLPAALMGFDVADLLKRAQNMADQCAVDVSAGRNPGLALGAIIGEASLAGRDKLCLITDPEFASLGSWLEQLIAESSGKEGKGIIPVDGAPVIIPSSAEKDRLYVYIRCSGEKQSQIIQLRSAGHPVLLINAADKKDLLAEFYRWEMAISYACMVLKINPYNQPNVQLSKTLTKEYIKAYYENGSLDIGEVLWESDKGQVYGKPFDGLKESASLSEVVKSFVNQAGEGDFIAINAYLPRNDAMTASLEALRKNIAEQTSKAVTLGFGPRFQHSTGQLHKGGKNNILVLYITWDAIPDFEVPTQNISFATLEIAQALGDLNANLNVGRRGIRIHLTHGKVKDLIG